MARRRKPDSKEKIQTPLAEPAPMPRAPLEEEAAAMADPETPSSPSPPNEQPEKHFPIVGIGASAGGLAAIEAFFSAMPAGTESGMAFVLVQHLSPDHKSMLCEIIRRMTPMQIYEVEDGMVVKPGCAYVIPPGRDMALLNGVLQLLEPSVIRGMRLPIDFFFRSLAKDQHERAICIVLSGTGSDGTLGARAVKGEGGMVMVQNPESTEYDGMPQSAIATGLVDYVLPPAEMPAQIIAYVTHPYVKRPVSALLPGSMAESTLNKICILLRDQIGHDFSQYKQNTVSRRVERRMAIHNIEHPAQYLRFMQNNRPEMEALFRDLLIGVTSFFRDAEAFRALQTQVIPRLFADRRAGEALRVWVCGCSTGEEAYSVAILIQEHQENLKETFRVQIFATDIDRKAIEQARDGVYPVSIAADVSSDRLARFFDQDVTGGPYRIHKFIRDLLVFSEQDVIRDPPFSRLDLICCRNLLIYLNADLQKKLIPLFHYSLTPGGALFLGSSETVGEFGTLFEALDRKGKIYLRQKDLTGAARPALGDFVAPLREGRTRPGPLRGVTEAETRVNFRELTEQALLQHYAQAGVLINGRGKILHIYGRTGKYLEPAPGVPGGDILPMAREGLRRELTTALHRVVTRKEPVRYQGLRVRTNGEFVTANLTVRPVGLSADRVVPAVSTEAQPAVVTDVFLVLLEDVTTEAQGLPGAVAEGTGQPATDADGRIAALEQELLTKEEYTQTTLEEMATANEELKSITEEMQSLNEELQSTNEELETSKEELQSTNEELATVNAELQVRVADLSGANNDMNNLLAGTGVGTLFLDRRLNIRRFTPAVTRVIPLIQTDIGRPVEHVVSNLVDYDRLVEDVKTVLKTLAPHDAEVRTKSGAWYLIHIQPFRTLENVIEGAVITFVDITEQKRMEVALRQAQIMTLCESIVATVREPLVVLDKDLRVVLANRAFYTEFQVPKDDTEGRLLFDLGNRQWDIPELRRLLEEILPRKFFFEKFRVTHDFEQIGRCTLLLNARRIFTEADNRELILLAMENITACGPAGQAGSPRDRADNGGGVP